MYEYQAKVIGVFDGDTVTLEVDLGFHFKFKNSYRLLRINAPEVRGESRVEGLKSRDRLRELILNKQVFITTLKDRQEKYGRYLVEIMTEVDGVLANVNDLLVTEGLAKYAEY